MNYLLLSLLLISLFLNGILSYLLIKSKKKPTPTKDALALINEAAHGGALVRLELLDHNDFLMRNPNR